MRVPWMASAWMALALAMLAPPAWAQPPLNPGIDVENRADIAIKELHIRADAAASWGENKLGGGPLAPGTTAAIRELTETTCRYQLRAVFQDGRTEERPVDICRHERIILGANGR